LSSTDSNVRSTPAYESQTSTSTPVSKSALSSTISTSKPERKYSKIHDIEVTVGDPTKVGTVRFIYFLLKLNKSNYLIGYVILYDISYNNKNNITII